MELEHSHHPTVPLYLLVFGALITLTGITVLVAFQDFGVMNNVIALGIAGLKTTLVVLFFMHVKYSSRLTKMFAAAGAFWLAILISFTLSDTLTRRSHVVQGWTPLPFARTAEPLESVPFVEHQPGQSGEHH
jgi:cytochrome c oxidase subunit 4